jgi:Lamin Tail Domain/PEP-CTERM motif
MNLPTRTLPVLAVLTTCISTLQAQVVINEFMYDDTGTDDREFVELYNAGPASVDIGNWVLSGRDPSGANAAVTIPAGTMLAPGGFWVIGNALVPNVNQVVGANAFENDNETLELSDSAATLIDAVLYEGNNTAAITLPPLQAAQIGSFYWPNHQGIDIGATGLTLTSVGRFINGRDTNNNGRDFGMRPGTPGTSNSVGVITNYAAPNVDAQADGATVSGTVGSFVSPRVFSPGVVSAALNPNAIPAPIGFNKAIIAWDQSGGGNGSISEAIFSNGGSFSLQVYFDTSNLPLSTNATGVPFRGSEETFFGIGSTDAFTNLSDISGGVNLNTSTVSANGATGIHWYYEKVGETGAGLGDVSEKLYLVDANDGGQSNADGPGGLDWTVLATIDLSSTPSGWYKLSLSIAPDGQGVAMFDNQTFNFTTVAGLVGEFSVGYRENTQDGAITVPGYLRPATYAVPEPGTFGLLGLAGVLAGIRRRRTSPR